MEFRTTALLLSNSVLQRYRDSRATAGPFESCIQSNSFWEWFGAAHCRIHLQSTQTWCFLLVHRQEQYKSSGRTSVRQRCCESPHKIPACLQPSSFFLRSGRVPIAAPRLVFVQSLPSSRRSCESVCQIHRATRNPGRWRSHRRRLPAGTGIRLTRIFHRYRSLYGFRHEHWKCHRDARVLPTKRNLESSV